MADATGADDDLVAMYLTDKQNGTVRQMDDHEDLEVLLESFSKQVEEIVNEAENIQVRKNPHPCTHAFSHRLSNPLNVSSLVERAIYAGNRRVDIRF